MKRVIFGASGGAIKVAETFDNLGIPFEFFVDNDQKKWNSIINNRKVKAPDELLQDDYQIVIASDYQDEIEEQLQNMGIKNAITLKEQLILPKLLEKQSLFEELTSFKQEKRKESIIFDLIDAGICLGGIETWTLNLMRELKKRKENVHLFSRNIETPVPGDIINETELFNIEYDDYLNSILSIAKEIIKRLPCVIITNWQSQVMMAAIMVKNIYQGEVKVISAIHNDKITLYRRQKFFEPYTDRIIGVSKKINETLINVFQIPKEKVFYKESPVIMIRENHGKYSTEKGESLKIGFAARISKYQKRVDLLIQLIEQMDHENVNYHLQIAGDGSYFEQISKWHKLYKNSNKIELLGRVPREKMHHFWREQDIFLSVSDFEGASISMLEAMAAGAIPVVTRVSGVEEFVENGENGFYVEPRDIKGLCEKVIFLDNNREKLPFWGKQSMSIITNKCKIDDYTNVFIKVIHELI